MKSIHERALLVLIVLSFAVLGVVYAWQTPPWQVPDEPAHYNYVRYLVEQRRLPVLQAGDYDQAYLAEATSRRFASDISIDPIRYEYHQPPLYYVLAAPIYALFGGALLPLRLFSVTLGMGVLVVAYLVGKVAFPDRSWPALGGAAFMAYIPQHIAMTAGVENDVLAELLLGLVLLGLVRWLRSEGERQTRASVAIGLATGLGLLTKTTAYVALPLIVLAAIVKYVDRDSSGRWRARIGPAARSLGAMALPALLLGLPWFVRNAVVYGGLDILGLARHEQVVVGQLRTSEWIATFGWRALPSTFIVTTFRSFWAQFGWMAVPIDNRIYAVLTVLTLAPAAGFVMWVADRWEERPRTSWVGIVLACSALLTAGSFLWYNLTFYQAQGRYLFPALIPLGLAWSLGLETILERRNALLMGIVLLLAAAYGGVKCLMQACGSKWRVAIHGAAGAAFVVRRFLPGWLDAWLLVAPFLVLVAVCAVSPFLFIAPYLTP